MAPLMKDTALPMDTTLLSPQASDDREARSWDYVTCALPNSIIAGRGQTPWENWGNDTHFERPQFGM